MRTRDKNIAARQAQRWAEEEQHEVMSQLPDEIRRAIDWSEVARNLCITWPESEHPTIEQDIQRIVDYLYDDEASDYEHLERHFQHGHIFESLRAVQRWLCNCRT
jgi:hypothetical protein